MSNCYCPSCGSSLEITAKHYRTKGSVFEQASAIANGEYSTNGQHWKADIGDVADMLTLESPGGAQANVLGTIVLSATGAVVGGSVGLFMCSVLGSSPNVLYGFSSLCSLASFAAAIAYQFGAADVLLEQLPRAEPVEVESLELVAPKQAKLLKREVAIPLDAQGRRVCNEKDLLGFARMIRDRADSISYATGNEYGVKRTQFTKIRDWALSMAYLRWNIEGAPAQGVCVTRRGREYFAALLTQ